MTEMLLFLGARHQHYMRVIAPALAQGTTVISDRFHDSTRAYQGIARGLGLGYYDALHAAVLGNATPDLTFYLDIAPEAGLRRSTKRANHETRFEVMEIPFHHAVRNGFLQLAQSEPSRIRVIDAAAGDIEMIFAGILREWDDTPPLRGTPA